MDADLEGQLKDKWSFALQWIWREKLIWLDVPYHEKDEAKVLGARWDDDKKLWYSPSRSEFDLGLKKWAIEKTNYNIPGLNRRNSKVVRKKLLNMELVPQTSWYTNVRSNVSTDIWDYLRKEFYAKANHRCEVCDGRGTRHPVELHEVWHYDDKTFVQTLVNMIVLCPACHEVKHMGLAGIKGRADIAKKWLQFVNAWSQEETDKHIDDCWRIWSERSKVDWTLDLSFLDQFDLDIEPFKSSPVQSKIDKPLSVKANISSKTTTKNYKSSWERLIFPTIIKILYEIWMFVKFATKTIAVIIGFIATVAFLMVNSTKNKH